MGTFLSYIGKVNIPEDKREEFLSRAQQVFYYGGMMGHDIIPLNGKKILLLHPPEKEGEGYINCTFNYYESDFCESAGVGTPNPYIYSGKVGWSDFNNACCAAYLLQEIYSSDYGMVLLDGDIIKGYDKIGWLNYLFDESYTNKRLASPWHLMRFLRNDEDYNRYHDWDSRSLPKWYDFDTLSPNSVLSAAVAREPNYFDPKADAESQSANDSETGIGQRHAMHKALKAIVDDPAEATEQKLEKLKSILASKERANEVIQGDGSESYRTYARLSNVIPVPISVAILMQTFEGLDFWGVYDEVQAGDDERAELYTFMEGKEPKPIAKVTTETLFDVCGDDRAFWWREGGDVVFSDEMNVWLVKIKGRLDELARSEPPYKTGAEFRSALADVLSEELFDKYRVYMFRDTFYEMISDWRSGQTQAALVLMRQLVDEVKASEQPSSDIERVRSYISVLANPDLRKKALGLEIMG